MEFDLIQRYFRQPFQPLAQDMGVTLGIGDDCAIVRPPTDHLLFLTTDTLVEGVHYFPSMDPQLLGHKSLAVSVSDVLACGAKPLAFSLNLSLSMPNPEWLAGFSTGLLRAAQRWQCPLIGGDTTGMGGAKSDVISVTLLGSRHQSALPWLRSLGRAGHQLCVTGLPGAARMGLLAIADGLGQLNQFLDNTEEQRAFRSCWAEMPKTLQEQCISCLEQPQPRSQWVEQVANLMPQQPLAALDLSDGLSGDLQHLSSASQVAIVLEVSALQTLWLQAWPQAHIHLPCLVQASVAGGDDYELAFLTPKEYMPELLSVAMRTCTPLHAIGYAQAGKGVFLGYSDGRQMPLTSLSFNHFS